MNKKILALAIGALLAAPAAFAATGNVDIYGQMRLGLDAARNSGGYTRPQVTDYASRIGFKGAEDLGDGLKAIWQVEEQFSADGGGGGLFSSSGNPKNFRNTFVGLSGGWGTTLLGTHDTPYKLATASLDIFADTVADYNAIMGAASGVAANSGFDLRPGNVVAYITPTFSGFHAAIAYVAGAETGGGNKTLGGAQGTNKGNAWSLAGIYNDGPIFASLAWEKHHVGNANGTLSNCALGLDDCDPGTLHASRSAWKVGGGYDFGVAKIAAGYEKQKWDAGLGDLDHSDWFLNGIYKMGNISLKAEYAHATKSTAAKNVGANDKGSLWAIGGVYNFSKRTDVDLTWAHVSNSTNALYNFGAGSNPINIAAGSDPSVLSLQVNHAF